jgi:DNA (cytosine-5)-methyltransferase 1
VYLNKLKVKAVKPPTFRIVYLQSHIRTRKWFKDGKVFVWDSEEVQDCQYGSLKTKRKERSL